MPTYNIVIVIMSPYFSFEDGEEEKTVSVLLNGEESSMSFVDPDADTVSMANKRDTDVTVCNYGY